MRSLNDILDLSVEEIDQLIHTSEDIIKNPDSYREACKNKKLVTLFFEPSTRTRLSFEAAMHELGGQVMSVTDVDSSSVSKGESISDTTRTISCYADVLAMRHPLEGAALVAAQTGVMSVINAGDGGHCHPTQTLADLLTIYRRKGRLNHLTVGVCGDLKYGRTTHSLIGALSRYPGVRFVMIAPRELRIRAYVTEALRFGNIPYEETESLDDALPELDILYMTRIQRERFSHPELYEQLKDSYILTPEKLTSAKEDMCVLHPLPRVNEISKGVDSDPRACYFEQMLNGKFIRMALILKLLKDEARPIQKQLSYHLHCRNPRCICQTEQELRPAFYQTAGLNPVYRCVYCEHQARD